MNNQKMEILIIYEVYLTIIIVKYAKNNVFEYDKALLQHVTDIFQNFFCFYNIVHKQVSKNSLRTQLTINVWFICMKLV